MEQDNLKLWNSVEKTNPSYTKAANVAGNKITAISPQYQIKNVTEQFGSYGSTWGFKDIQLDYTLVNTPFMREKTEGVYPNKKVVGFEEAVMGMVVFKGIFFYPNGEFPIISSISLFTNNDMTKLDDNFAKKVETDALTKAISKLGFNADIFMGKFDDVRYVEEMKKEFAQPTVTPKVVPTVTTTQPDKVVNGSAATFDASTHGSTTSALQPSKEFNEEADSLMKRRAKALEAFNKLDAPTVIKHLVKNEGMRTYTDVKTFVNNEPIDKVLEIYGKLTAKN